MTEPTDETPADPEWVIGCKCVVIGSERDPAEPHIPAQPIWEQAEDCPIHPLSPTEGPTQPG